MKWKTNTLNNVTYYQFLQFFPENSELTKFQFSIATGLVIWIKEKNLLHEGPNSGWIYRCCSFKQKPLPKKPLVPLKPVLWFLMKCSPVTVMAVAVILREHYVI